MQEATPRSGEVSKETGAEGLVLELLESLQGRDRLVSATKTLWRRAGHRWRSDSPGRHRQPSSWQLPRESSYPSDASAVDDGRLPSGSSKPRARQPGGLTPPPARIWTNPKQKKPPDSNGVLAYTRSRAQRSIGSPLARARVLIKCHHATAAKRVGHHGRKAPRRRNPRQRIMRLRRCGRLVRSYSTSGRPQQV